MDKLNQLADLIQGIKADGEKFFNSGNDSAGTRVRKAMQEVKNLAQEVRNDVTAKRNNK